MLGPVRIGELVVLYSVCLVPTGSWSGSERRSLFTGCQSVSRAQGQVKVHLNRFIDQRTSCIGSVLHSYQATVFR
jgi:hypothetical protein